MSEWTVGQVVIMREPLRRREPREVEVTITRVGRKYVYAREQRRWAPERVFHIDGGREKVGSGFGARIFASEGLVEHKRRLAAEAELRRLMRDSWHRSLSTEAIEQILAIIRGAERGDGVG